MQASAHSDVPTMLVTLGIFNPRWLRGLDAMGGTAIGHFRTACAQYKLPLQLGQRQIKAFLQYLYKGSYRVTSFCQYWSVFRLMLNTKAGVDNSFNPELDEENELLLETVLTLAPKVKDTKLVVTRKLMTANCCCRCNHGGIQHQVGKSLVMLCLCRNAASLRVHSGKATVECD